MKTWIIGDIHGCAGPLSGMIKKLNPNPSEDRLILLGDLFDRGPDSWEVWQQAQRLEETFGERFTSIRISSTRAEKMVSIPISLTVSER